MPIHRVKGGYQWGSKGKVYKTRAGAARQARAAFANGYRGDSKLREHAMALKASKKAEDRYAKGLRQLMRGVILEYEKELGSHLKAFGPQVRHDAGGYHKHTEGLDLIDQVIRVQIPKHVAPLFDRMALTVREASRKGFANLVGIRPKDTGIEGVIAVARDENIRLVENAARVYAKQVREIFDDPYKFGDRVEDLKAALLERASVSESRAELIARDQTLKLNGDINQERQTQAGITQYVWSTSQDERVRPMHAELNGETFDWHDPPVTNEAGDVNHPGQDFQCRCVAVGVISELEGI